MRKIKVILIFLCVELFFTPFIFAAAITDSCEPLGHLNPGITLEDNYIFERDLEKGNGLTSAKMEDTNQIYTRLGLGLGDYFNVYTKLGAVRGSDYHFVSANKYDYETGVGFLWGLGLGGEYEFSKNWKVAGDVQFDSWRADVEKAWLDGEGGSNIQNPQIDNSELQVTFLLLRDFELPKSRTILTPYVGLGYSYFKSETEREVTFTTSSYIVSADWDLHSENTINIVTGLKARMDDNWKAFLEGRFLAEKAITCGLTYDWGASYRPEKPVYEAERKKNEYPVAPLWPGWEFGVDFQGGEARYEEHASSVGVDSKWQEYFNRVNLSLGNYDLKRLEGGFKGSFFASLEDTEKWNLDGGLYQENTMDLSGGSFLAEVGWALGDGTKPSSDALIFTPLLGYGYNRIQFTRSNFRVLGTVIPIGEVSEDYDVHYIDIGGKLNFTFDKNILFDLRSSCGIVFYNQASNSAIGSIDGDGGYIPKIEVRLRYLATPDFTLSIGGFFEQQHLEGGMSSSAEWPDNNLSLYGATVGGSYKWGGDSGKRAVYRPMLQTVSMEPKRINRPSTNIAQEQPVPLESIVIAQAPVKESRGNGLAPAERLDRLESFYKKGLVSKEKYVEEKRIILTAMSD